MIYSVGFLWGILSFAYAQATTFSASTGCSSFSPKPAPDAEPKHWDSCPKCGTTEFERIERESHERLRTPASGPVPDMRV